jgi:hypothetical protein
LGVEAPPTAKRIESWIGHARKLEPKIRYS